MENSGLLFLASHKKGATIFAISVYCRFFRVQVLTRHPRRKHGHRIQQATMGCQLGCCDEPFSLPAGPPAVKQTRRHDQNQGRLKTCKRKPDLGPANFRRTYQGCPGLWLKEAIASKAFRNAVCFPGLEALAGNHHLAWEPRPGKAVAFLCHLLGD